MVEKVLGAKIEISELVKKFGDVVAVDKVSLTIDPGKFVTLLGPSGSGKTTILKIVAGFEKPTEGEVYINGEPVSHKPSYKRDVGLVFQNYALFPHLTVAENISFPLRMRKVNRQEIKKRVSGVLDLVKLPGFERRYPKQLSGGQQQRIALARCLIFNPSVLLMDEPLGALDKKLREHMQLELKRISEQLRLTIIYVTHDQSEALNMSDMIAVLNDGRLQQVGSPRDLYENPENFFVADFIGESNFIKGKVASQRGGMATVTTDLDRNFIVPGKSAFQEGNDVVIVVHPEKIRILEKEDENVNSLRGKISDVVYLGEITKYYVLLSNGQTLYMKLHNRSDTRAFRVNDEVLVGWLVDDCKLTR